MLFFVLILSSWDLSGTLCSGHIELRLKTFLAPRSLRTQGCRIKSCVKLMETESAAQRTFIRKWYCGSATQKQNGCYDHGHLRGLLHPPVFFWFYWMFASGAVKTVQVCDSFFFSCRLTDRVEESMSQTGDVYFLLGACWLTQCCRALIAA